MGKTDKLYLQAFKDIINGDRDEAKNKLSRLSNAQLVEFMRNAAIAQNVGDRVMAEKGA